jgi:hypothetical protein
MNITSRAPRYGNWDTRRLRHLLAACVAGFAISVAVAVGLSSAPGSGGSTLRHEPLSIAPSSQAVPTYVYIVDSQEKADMVAMAQAEEAAAVTPNGYLSDHYAEVIDISTVEGQRLLESFNAGLVEAAGDSGLQSDVRFIYWTD